MAHQNSQGELLAPALLVLASLAGFFFSNSSQSGLYTDLLNTPVALRLGEKMILDKTVLLLINDGLMAIFFLFVGLELKREIVVGELSGFQKSMLPICAAVGGMVVPALIYLAANMGSETSIGWGIPMATDIAFALGILAVLGSRVPATLKVVLAAIAIVDDLGAILVIALFYTSHLDLTLLAASFFVLGMCFVMNRLGIMRLSLYLALGVFAWYFMLKSGVHATIAGVLLAATIPLAPKKSNRAMLISDIFNKKASPLDSPAVFLEKSLLKWVGLFIVPVFAFANSGVNLGSVAFGTVTLGIILGLTLGKPVGIVSAIFLAKIAGLVRLPGDCTWRQLAGIGCLAGIGFTMSLFINSLAFGTSAFNDEAKLAILGASLISGFCGIMILALPAQKGKASSPK